MPQITCLVLVELRIFCSFCGLCPHTPASDARKTVCPLFAAPLDIDNLLVNGCKWQKLILEVIIFCLFLFTINYSSLNSALTLYSECLSQICDVSNSVRFKLHSILNYIKDFTSF